MITKLWKTDTCLSKYNNLNHSLVGQYLSPSFTCRRDLSFIQVHARKTRPRYRCSSCYIIKNIWAIKWELEGDAIPPPNTFIASPKYLLDNIGHEKYVFFNLAKNEQPIPPPLWLYMLQDSASPIFLFFRYWKSWYFQFIKEWQYIVYTTFQLKYNKNMLIKI